MRHFAFFIAFTLLTFLSSCDNDPERMDSYFVDFATVVKESANYRFILDNGRLLIPNDVKGFSGDEGQRVVLNYIPIEENRININFVSKIFTGKLQQNGFPKDYSNDPLKIQSVWISGGWLNLIMETEYHSVPHSIGLLRDVNSPTIDLYLSHATNNDPPGYPKMLYASFRLTDLYEQTTNTNPIPVRLFINTYTGMRIMELELK